MDQLGSVENHLKLTLPMLFCLRNLYNRTSGKRPREIKLHSAILQVGDVDDIESPGAFRNAGV
jgi:hypothetical protein